MKRDGNRRRLLGQAALVVALLAAAVRAEAQPRPYQTTDYDAEIATLRGLIQEFESGETMIIASNPPSPYGWFVAIERARVGPIAGWLVTSGQLHPDSVSSWTREQLALSQGALAVMKKQLEDLEAKRVTPPIPTTPSNAALPPGSATWPTPMNWREVRGSVRGTYSIQCSYRGPALPPVSGTFTLELRGQGVVFGSFTDTGTRTVEEMNGEISDRGLANGNARSMNAITAWSAKFVRVGNDLKVQNPLMTMVPFQEGARCDPGVVQQQ